MRENKRNKTKRHTAKERHRDRYIETQRQVYRDTDTGI